MKKHFFSSLLLITLAAQPLQAYYYLSDMAERNKVHSRTRKLLNEARAGDVNAMRTLGKMLIDGNIVKRDLKNGVLWLKKAVKAGDPRSMVLLGDLYRHGRGVSKDAEKAAELYMQAAELGNKNAEKRLAKMPYEVTVPWWEKRAEDGDKEAMLKMIRAYASGDGVAADMDKARELYERANKKWPDDVEKTIQYLTDEQQLALVEPPKPEPEPEPVVTPKPRPVVHTTPTRSIDYDSPLLKVYDTGMWVDPPSQRIAGMFYINGTKEGLILNYEYTLNQLYKLLKDCNEDESLLIMLQSQIVGSYAWLQLNRLTLINKYGVSDIVIKNSNGQLRMNILIQMETMRLKCEKMEQKNKWAALEILTLLSNWLGGVTEVETRKTVLSDCMENCFISSLIYLKEVTSSSAENFAVRANAANLSNYVHATMPSYTDAVDLKKFSNILLQIDREVQRIKNASYYYSPVIREKMGNF